jgi:hypothetical protein
VSGNILFHRSDPKNFFGVVQTSMRDFAHEAEYELQVLIIHVAAALDSLADQPQNFQTAEDHLMFLDARRGRVHTTPSCFLRHTFSASVQRSPAQAATQYSNG